MTLRKFAFIASGSELDPARHRISIQSPSFELIVVGVAHPAQGADVARGLLAEGVELIELCGGFGPRWTGEVLAALEHRIPVGSVAYGPESVDSLQRLFAD